MAFDPNDLPWWAQSLAPPQGVGLGGPQGFGLPNADGSTFPNDWMPAADAVLGPFVQAQNAFSPGLATSQAGPGVWPPQVPTNAFENSGLRPALLSFPPGFGSGGILGSLGSGFGTGGILGSLANLGQASSPSATEYSSASSPGLSSNSSLLGNPPPSPWDIPPNPPWSLSSGAIQGIGGAPNVYGLNLPQAAPPPIDLPFDTSGGAAPPQVGASSNNPSSSFSDQYHRLFATRSVQFNRQPFSGGPSPVDWAIWPATDSLDDNPAISPFNFSDRPTTFGGASAFDEVGEFGYALGAQSGYGPQRDDDDNFDVIQVGGQYNVKNLTRLNDAEEKLVQELLGRIGVGPYASPNGGVPLSSPYGRGSAAERQQNNFNGQEFGCHTCGTKDSGTPSGNPVFDHQPQQSLNPPPGASAQAYPQCASCSSIQGGIVSWILHLLRIR